MQMNLQMYTENEGVKNEFRAQNELIDNCCFPFNK